MKTRLRLCQCRRVVILHRCDTPNNIVELPWRYTLCVYHVFLLPAAFVYVVKTHTSPAILAMEFFSLCQAIKKKQTYPVVFSSRSKVILVHSFFNTNSIGFIFDTQSLYTNSDVVSVSQFCRLYSLTYLNTKQSVLKSILRSISKFQLLFFSGIFLRTQRTQRLRLKTVNTQSRSSCREIGSFSKVGQRSRDL